MFFLIFSLAMVLISAAEVDNRRKLAPRPLERVLLSAVVKNGECYFSDNYKVPNGNTTRYGNPCVAFTCFAKHYMMVMEYCGRRWRSVDHCTQVETGKGPLFPWCCPAFYCVGDVPGKPHE
uniref:8.9 kDa family member n=1 Tax=Rhipicephalus appendiculatus TaxID=34631 RepID=A0A131YSR8_RHIAP